MNETHAAPQRGEPETLGMRTALEQVLGFVERWGEDGHIPLCGSLDGDPCTCGLDEARATLAAEVGPHASERALADVEHQRDVLERRLEQVEHERDRLLALVDTGAEVSPPITLLPLREQMGEILRRLDGHAVYLRGYRNATLAAVADDCQTAARMLRDLRSDHTAMMRMWMEEEQAITPDVAKFRTAWEAAVKEAAAWEREATEGRAVLQHHAERAREAGRLLDDLTALFREPHYQGAARYAGEEDPSSVVVDREWYERLRALSSRPAEPQREGTP